MIAPLTAGELLCLEPWLGYTTMMDLFFGLNHFSFFVLLTGPTYKCACDCARVPERALVDIDGSNDSRGFSIFCSHAEIHLPSCCRQDNKCGRIFLLCHFFLDLLPSGIIRSGFGIFLFTWLSEECDSFASPGSFRDATIVCCNEFFLGL